MINDRADHACALIKRNGRDYLVVMGGTVDLNATQTDSIEFYDLTLRPASWVNQTGMRLPEITGTLYGWKIQQFDEGVCDAFLINWHGTEYTCSGNYSWTLGMAPGYSYAKCNLPVVDANLMGGDTVW
jgi:hypothetical protein